MAHNPLVNALVASLYIALVASVMFYGPHTVGKKETVMVPIAVLSLFVLSAAVMGYFFLCGPLLLSFDGEKKRAVRLFLSTVGIFAGITALILAVLFLFPPPGK